MVNFSASVLHYLTYLKHNSNSSISFYVYTLDYIFAIKPAIILGYAFSC